MSCNLICVTYLKFRVIWLQFIKDVTVLQWFRKKEDRHGDFCSYLPYTVAFIVVVSKLWSISNNLKRFEYCLWENDALIRSLCALSFYNCNEINCPNSVVWIVLLFVQKHTHTCSLSLCLYMIFHVKTKQTLWNYIV